jgi:2,4-dienoyl-CoA reductase-like NADH-dependent reductase (Old Yellow Enzyme family)
MFTPLSLAPGVVAPNRVWLAPLTNLQSHPDGTCSDAEVRFLGQRADGGFGLVETCAAYVSPEGKAWPGELGVHEDAMSAGLTRLAARIHAGGALASAQLFHGGLRATPDVSGQPRWSASPSTETGAEARGGTDADIAAVIDAFAQAARRCADAGFDVVELHGAHGYLLSQFQSTVYNTRTDAWGGTLDHRARLIRAVARAVRAAAPGVVLAVRLSPEDFGQARGIDLDETLQLAAWLAEDGMGLLHLSLWRSASSTVKRPGVHPTPLFRDAVGPLPIVVAGGIWTRDDAQTQLDRGADAVALGRAAIAWHDWPRRIAAGETPAGPPYAPAHLAAEGLAPGFVDYMRRWKGFVDG